MVDKGRPVRRFPDMLTDNDRRDLNVGSSSSASGLIAGSLATHASKNTGVHGAGEDYLLNTGDVDDVPVDGETAAPISSNWAYDHENGTDPHAQYLLVDGTRAMSGDLNFASHEAVDMVVHNVSDDTEKNSLTPIEGKLVYQSDTKGFYICTSIA